MGVVVPDRGMVSGELVADRFRLIGVVGRGNMGRSTAPIWQRPRAMLTGGAVKLILAAGTACSTRTSTRGRGAAERGTHHAPAVHPTRPRTIGGADGDARHSAMERSTGVSA
jgi:hypothetical protein